MRTVILACAISVEGLLHEDGIEPLIEFETDGLKGANVPETKVLMQADGGRIGAIADNSDDLLPRAARADIQERAEEGAAATASGEFGVDVNGIFDGKPIGWARAVSGSVGKGDHLTTHFGDKVR